MVQRQRLLLISGIALLALLGTWFCFAKVSGMFTAKYDALDEAERAARKKQQEVKREERLQRDLRDRIATSMSAQNPEAVRNYRNWLLALVAETGFEQQKITPMPARVRSAMLQQIPFKVKARADLQGITNFLVKFYTLKELHQIRSLRLTPLPNSQLLDVDMTIEVLAGKGSERVLVATAEGSADDVKLLADMATAVVNRNCFGDMNLAPKWSDVNGTKVATGESLELKLAANDENAQDALTYELLAGPEGAKLDPKTGQFQWRAGDKGEYEVKVAVSDNGLPRQRSEVTFKIAVTDPPPTPRPVERERFDHAPHAFVVGTMVSGEVGPQVLIHVRTTGRTLRLKQGEKVSVGSVKGEIAAIGAKDVELTTDKGRLRVPLGEALTAGQVLEASAVTSSDAVTEPTSTAESL